MAAVTDTPPPKVLNVAVEGCCHGQLDEIYDTILHIQQVKGVKVDLLLICGDFQAVRNYEDLACMACPVKYKKIGTFYKYYSGEKTAPIPTIFIGGNHEASNYLQELPLGGWVAPNIYFLGYAGIVNFGGIRIGGLSGIYKSAHYHIGHYERPPYTESSMRSVYHVREQDMMRLMQVKEPLDVFLSHDWPAGITKYGDVKGLLRRKPFFRSDIERDALGNPHTDALLAKLQPSYWFAAHMHCKFVAVVPHEGKGDAKTTKFLSLDKCLPGRDFLQVVQIPVRGETHSHELREDKISLDPEWLGIVKGTYSFYSTRPPKTVPDVEIHVRRMKERSSSEEGLLSPPPFGRTVQHYVAGDVFHPRRQPDRQGNPQTDELLKRLQEPHLITIPYGKTLAKGGSGGTGGLVPQLFEVGGLTLPTQAFSDPCEIDLDDLEEDSAPTASQVQAADDPNEIDLDDEI